MNFKIFFRMVLVFLVSFVLVIGVVAAGVALSQHIISKQEGFFKFSNDSQGGLGGFFSGGNKKQQSLNVLLLGVDKDGYRTDTIILAQYNFNTKQLNMLHIPRDTRIITKRYDKKINSAYAFGKEKEVFAAVKSLIGINVDKYILFNLGGFRKLIDEIGGVEMDVPINMNYDDPYQNLHIHLRKGKQVLDGKKAEMFVRFRKNNNGTGYADGDIGRIKAQQQFIEATIDKLISIKNITKIPKLVTILFSNVKTNFDIREITGYADDAIKLNKSNINMLQLPGESGFNGGVSYFIANDQKTKEMVKTYFSPDSVPPVKEQSLKDNKTDEYKEINKNQKVTRSFR